MKKVYCFLDIDGVIATLDSNREKWLEVQGLDMCAGDSPADRILPRHNSSCDYWPFCPKAVAQFHRLQLQFQKKELELHTIISSSWRIGKTTEELKDLFALKGLHVLRMAGRTGNLETRGEEILEVVKALEISSDSYFTIDDEVEYDIRGHIPDECLFIPTFKEGLTSEIVDEILTRFD